MIKYKLVSRADDGQLFSLYPYCGCVYVWQVDYKIGEWAEAKVGGLLVFRRKKDAMQFIFEQSETTKEHIALFRCEVKEKVRLPVRGFDLGFLLGEVGERLPSDKRSNMELLKDFWKNRIGFKYPRYTHSWSPGTEAYRKVKLIEEVK